MHVKSTYTRTFNSAGGVEQEDCREVIITNYAETGAIEFRFADTGETVQDTISSRNMWNDNGEDVPENWELFTTINPY